MWIYQYNNQQETGEDIVKNEDSISLHLKRPIFTSEALNTIQQRPEYKFNHRLNRVI